MKPDAYGRCRHSMVISLRSSGVPVWPGRDGIVQARCSLLSSRGDPEQSGSRTPPSPLLPPARQKDPNPLQTHTRPRPRGRATFLLTAATLEWITKPIWVAQKGACLALAAQMMAFVCI